MHIVNHVFPDLKRGRRDCHRMDCPVRDVKVPNVCAIPGGTNHPVDGRQLHEQSSQPHPTGGGTDMDDAALATRFFVAKTRAGPLADGAETYTRTACLTVMRSSSPASVCTATWIAARVLEP